MLIARIGDGGMGTVWEAEQDEPRRAVALKTIHPHKVSRRARRRFRFEAQAMGSLLHPGIPQVYAAGDDGGRLYLAMEKVDGQPLDHWRVHTRPGRAELLETFAAICDAVHHAHLRGVVHRDLKPANVLVTDDGQPKVLDFGIAQALGADGDGRISGTPTYMSPEQVLGARVDVRTDVWALGVLLFELLSGRPPLDMEGLTAHKLVVRVTSTPLPRLGELDPSLRGDLEAIVARALERDADERYASAALLADDLRRHLGHRPVQARPATAAYRLGRWARRNLQLTLALGGIFLALSTGLGLAFGAYLDAEAARRAEADQRAAAERALAAVEVERRRAEAVTAFLGDVFVAAHPDHSPGREITVVEAMDAAVEQLEEGDLSDQPAVEVAVRVALALAYRGLSRDDASEAMLERAVALRPTAGATEDGVAAALYLADRHRGIDDDRATALLRDARTDAQHLFPSGVHETWQGLYHTEGRIHRAADRYGPAEEAFRQALRVAAERPEAEAPTATWNQLGHALRSVGRFAEAEALYQQALAEDRRVWGDPHPQVATGLLNVGTTQALAGDPRGLETLQQALAMRVDLLGPDHRRSINARLAVAQAHADARQALPARDHLDEAEASYVRSHEGRRADAAYWHHLRGRVSLLEGQVDQAVAHGDAAVARYTAERGAEAVTTQRAQVARAEALAARGERAAAEHVLRRAIEHLVAKVGTEAVETRRAQAVLARIGD